MLMQVGGASQSSSEELDSAALKHFGHYQVLRKLGAGGFATAWLAFDAHLDRQVAIKVLHADAAAQPDVRHRFLQEAQLLSRARPTLAIGVHSRGETPDGRPYIVMEFAEGGSLEQRLAPALAERPLDVVDIRRLITDIGLCLGSLHRVGIVHRDVKPSNFLIRQTMADPDGEPLNSRYLQRHEQLVVADLGVARLTTTDAGPAASLRVGTPDWSAPEQFFTTAAPTAAADLFAATLIVLWAASGERPRIDGALESGVSVGADVGHRFGSGFVAAIQRGSALRPADRFNDAKSWTRGLLDAIGTDRAGVTRQPGLGQTTVPPPQPLPPQPPPQGQPLATSPPPRSLSSKPPPQPLRSQPLPRGRPAAPPPQGQPLATSPPHQPPSPQPQSQPPATSPPPQPLSPQPRPPSPQPQSQSHPPASSPSGPTPTGSSATPSPTTITDAGDSREGRRRRWPIVMALLLAGALGTVGVLLTGRDQGGDRVIGPSQIAVGDAATYYLADATGSPTWLIGDQRTTATLLEFDATTPGELRIEVSDDTSTVARTIEVVPANAPGIDGPASIAVGQVGVYTVDDAAGSVVWTIGGSELSEPVARITPTSPGVVSITARIDSMTSTRQITVVP
jgi:serine/threonine protein kinase